MRPDAPGQREEAGQFQTRWLLVGFGLYAASLLVEAWWPFSFSFRAGFPGGPGSATNWLPFASLISRHRIDLEAYARKLGAFIPVGILLGACWARRLAAPVILLRTVLVAACLGCFIQVGRYFIPGRWVDSGDVVVNICGALLGASPVYYARWSRRTLGVLTLACAAGFVVAATWPWRFSLQSFSFASISARVEWSPFRGSPSLGMLRERALNGLMTLPLGLLGATFALRDRRARPALVMTTGIGLGCSAAVELLQCFLPHRTPSLSDILLNTLGAFAGGVVALYFAGWRRPKPAAGARPVPPASAG